MSSEAFSEAAAAASMPGFRFHPTDEELVCYFLKRKVCGKSFPFDAISEVEIYKYEPWDLTGLSQLKSRDLEWYFFSSLDKKYGSGSRTNRTTERGYWKTTGKEKEIKRNARTIGMKKTLVYHIGRAPHGERTNWVMHEYRLEDDEFVEAGVLQDAYVVCRVFQKSGPGPKNGEQYGAPFIEEEWDDMVPQEASGNADSFYAGEKIDLDQNPEMSVINGNAAPVTSFNGPDNFKNPMDSVGFLDGAHSENLLEDPNLSQLHQNQELSVNVIGNTTLSKEPGNQDLFISMGEPVNSSEVDQTYSRFFDEDCIEENDIVNLENVDQPNGEIEDHLMYFDASTANNQSLIEDGLFFEWNDLSNPFKADGSSRLKTVNDYLTYFDAIDNKWHYDAMDPSCKQLEKENFISDQLNPAVEANGWTVELNQACQRASNAHDMGGASSSGQNIVGSDGSRVENSNFKSANVAIASDVKNEGGSNNSLSKRFTSLLDSIPSPPAFAAEYPLNEGVKSIKQNSASTSSSIYVNAEAFCMSQLVVTDSTEQWSVKKGDVGFLLSYGIRRDGGVMMGSEHLVGNSFGLGPLVEMSSKATSVLRSGFYLCFVWVLILLATFKIGNYFYAR